jgi:hypothetical protein
MDIDIESCNDPNKCVCWPVDDNQASGLAIADWWIDHGQPSECIAPDGTFVHRVSLIDQDYEMCWLLGLSADRGAGPMDLLAVSHRRGSLVAEWHQHPRVRFGGDSRTYWEWLEPGIGWFTRWARVQLEGD